MAKTAVDRERATGDAGRQRPSAPRRPKRKRAGRYHHGDLRRALIDEALRTVAAGGVEALTLRAVGERLGVSRTALYRHFADKSALLAAVGLEGFKAFRAALQRAVDPASGAVDFAAMGHAYVAFARANPAHYRVMFGGFLEACRNEPDLESEAGASFEVLVDAIAAEQRAGRLRDDDPRQMARYVWAVVHGLAMFAIDGQLMEEDVDAAVAYAVDRLTSGLAAPSTSRARSARQVASKD